jgi:hypothetical protein
MSQPLEPIGEPTSPLPSVEALLRADSAVTAEDIACEIADHIEARRDELLAAGLPAEAAEAEARRRFGDVREVARELHRIHHGDQIMSQRLTWIALAVLLLAIGANAYWQQRTTAALNTAIAALGDKLTRGTQPPMGTARVRVVDEEGRPRAGMNVKITGANPSPVLSNSRFSRTYVSDDKGGFDAQLLLGAYHIDLDAAQGLGVISRVPIENPGLNLFFEGEVGEVLLRAPHVRAATITLNLPDVPSGWNQPKYVDYYFRGRGELKDIDGNCSVPLGEPVAVPYLPNADVWVSFEVSGRLSPRFVAGQRLWAADQVPSDGMVITLDHPHDMENQSRIAENGRWESVASQPSD